jgi:hypothetical protein
MAEELKNDRSPLEGLGLHRDADLVQALDDCATGCLHGCLEATRGQQEHSVWMKLFAASQRLKLAVHEQNVAEAILEIGSNLMACEEMAVLELQGASLSFLASCGIDETQKQALIAKSGKIVAEIERRQVTVMDGGENWLWTELGISAFVPVWHGHQPRAAIVLYRFLPQRNGFDEGDRELLQLFSIYSGPCLFNA